MSQSPSPRRTSLTFFSESKENVGEDQSPRVHCVTEFFARGEEDFGQYGGDDIHDPSPKEPPDQVQCYRNPRSMKIW